MKTITVRATMPRKWFVPEDHPDIEKWIYPTPSQEITYTFDSSGIKVHADSYSIDWSLVFDGRFEPIDEFESQAWELLESLLPVENSIISGFSVTEANFVSYDAHYYHQDAVILDCNIDVYYFQ